MISSLRFVAFRSCSDAGWSEAWTIYRHSFPPCEQWREEAYARAFADPLFEADGVWLGERLVGLVFHWDAGAYRYLEHLAFDPVLRGQGLGTQTLRTFTARYPKAILEIDPPEDVISVRRRGFYERAGFVMNPYEYVHPSFRRPFHAHRLMLMSYPTAIGPDEARAFAGFVRERVLRYSDHVRAELPRL